jgi:hypothetical protein
MGSWLLLIIAVAVTPVLWRVIDFAGKIWRERAHVTARCISMDAAAASGAMPASDSPTGPLSWSCRARLTRISPPGWGGIPAP